jgi:hypothetical protein
LRKGFSVAADRAAEDLFAADDRMSGSNEECDCASRCNGAQPHHATQLPPTHNHSPQVCSIRKGLTPQVIGSDPNWFAQGACASSNTSNDKQARAPANKQTIKQNARETGDSSRFVTGDLSPSRTAVR